MRPTPGEIAAKLWEDEDHVGRNGLPPTWDEIAAFDAPEDVRLVAAQLMANLWPRKAVAEYRRLDGVTYGGGLIWHAVLRPGVLPGVVDVVMETDVRDVRDRYNDLPEPRPHFPLTPVLAVMPIPTAASKRLQGRIIPAKLAQVHGPNDRRGRLFTMAGHLNRQGVLPGFKDLSIPAPSLPVALYDIGAAAAAERRGQGAPLALRLFVEGVLAVPPERRNGQPAALSVPLRELLAWLYPNRRPSPAEYWPRLMAAAEALDAARIEWYDHDTGRGGLWRVVSVGNIPRGPDALDDTVRIIVDLPPGSETGPQVSDNLRRWGVRSGPAYRLLLNLAYQWHDPGRTLVPVRGGAHWLRVDDPARYEYTEDADLVRLVYGPDPAGRLDEQLRGARNAAHLLADAGEIRILEDGYGRKYLPMLGGRASVMIDGRGKESTGGRPSAPPRGLPPPL